MRNVILAVAVTVLPAIAQTPPADKSLTFEVASIKPASLPTPGNGPMLIRGPSGGPGTKDPGRINYPYMSLKNILMIAYDVKNYQVNGPAWLDTERFDVTATMPPETTKEQFRIMLQNLLIERFKMTVHKESKELPMYSLIVNKAPKMKETALTSPPPDSDGGPPRPLGPPKIGPDGFPVMPPEMSPLSADRSTRGLAATVAGGIRAAILVEPDRDCPSGNRLRHGPSDAASGGRPKPRLSEN